MTWHLDLSAAPPSAPPDLDAQQRSVVAHRSGPLLVLAGPGTGKTTTIVEAIADRLQDADDPVGPESVLALTFGRKAALELRDRVTARLGGGLLPTVSTFHSFAYALLRLTATPEEYLHPPRLMSGAEEDVRIRELLRGAVSDGTIEWPDELVGALPTLGLANEVRAVLSRARELGLEGDDLARIGRRSGRPAWVAVGQLARQEQDVMLLENVIDYGELMLRAVLRAHEPQVTQQLRAQYRAVYVDEFQDTDPLQVLLLRALVGPQTSVVAVGDPDQSIYAFRGADVGGLLRFPETFRTPAGEPAPVVVLEHTRRFGPRIRAAAVAALGTRLPSGLASEVMLAHRSPSCPPPADPDTDDLVTVRLFSDRGVQAAHLARDLRQAHVERDVPWHELAVLVRSGNQIPVVQRALAVAGVPVVVAADEVPLRAEPAVAALLAALALAAHPGAASAAQVIDVLTGPLVRLSSMDLRRLGRALRAEHHEEGFATPGSDVLVRSFVLGALTGEPAILPAIEESDPLLPVVAACERLTRLLREVHDAITAGAAPEQVLWTLWSGGIAPHGWPERLREAALRGSRSADHDLDAVMALFDTAERLAGRYPGFLGVRMFLDALADQQLPAEAVAERGARADAVRILTAHRAKGLEWDEVWIVGAEEGVWPDLRARGSTLRAEELSAEGVGSGPRSADLLEEERRLFYVACTRARRRLHLTAIDERADGGERPSRFLDDVRLALGLGDDPPQSVRPRRTISLDGLVAELRRTAADPGVSAALRSAAITRLAVLAVEQGDDGRPLVPLADPDRWWGVPEGTPGARAVRDPERPVALSGSGLDGLLTCPLRWFLDHEVRAETPRGPATGFGSVVHAIADFVAKGQVPAELTAMDAEVDRVWSALRFEARWQSQTERAAAHEALARFLGYHERADRVLVSTEARVRADVVVPTPGGGLDQVALSGYIDRVEADAEGRLVPIDLKNMKSKVPSAEVPEHGQLGVYQLIIREGGLSQAEPPDDEPGSPVPVGGAALVQLRIPAGAASDDPLTQFQDPLGDDRPTWVEVKLGEAAAIVRSEDFPARVGGQCRHCPFVTSCPAQSQEVLP
ncbi:MAG: AAA family ATPase [Actinomycetales bacterium]|nr:AAA family ATPase [Actinomycetales bacterium]